MCNDRAPRGHPRDNVWYDNVHTRSRGRSGCGPCPREVPRRSSEQARRPNANPYAISVGKIRIRLGTVGRLPRSRIRLSDRGGQNTRCRLRPAKSLNRRSQSCYKLFKHCRGQQPPKSSSNGRVGKEKGIHMQRLYSAPPSSDRKFIALSGATY